MYKKEPRRTVAEDDSVRTLRYENYKASISQIHKAMEAGFFVESITLIEGLLTDRMESLINELDGSTVGQSLTFKELTDKLQSKASAEYNEVLTKIDAWRKRRNGAVHSLPKELEPAFSARYDSLKSVAEDGYELFREFDKLLSEYRRTSIKK